MQLGSNYVYQAGIGRNIKSLKDKYIFSGLIEIDGQYFEKNKIGGSYDPNSGGNLIYLTPSLWLSTNKLTVQLGVSLPIQQSWNGNQNNISYLAVGSLGWTFY